MNIEVVKNSGKNIALTRSKFQIWSIFEDGGDKILKKYLTRQYCHIWSRIWGPYLKLWCRHVMLCTPNFGLMKFVKKKWKFEEKKVTRILENISHIFQNIAKIRDIFSKVGCKVWQSDDPKLEIVSGTGRS